MVGKNAESAQGLPIAGYKPTQPQWALDLVNENKVLEEKVLRQIEKHRDVNAKDVPIYGVAPLIDPVSIETAKMKIQEAFMWLNRGVFQPGRVKLPGDEDVSS